MWGPSYPGSIAMVSASRSHRSTSLISGRSRFSVAPSSVSCATATAWGWRGGGGGGGQTGWWTHLQQLAAEEDVALLVGVKHHAGALQRLSLRLLAVSHRAHGAGDLRGAQGGRARGMVRTRRVVPWRRQWLTAAAASSSAL
jgi:hypothetical protein